MPATSSRSISLWGAFFLLEAREKGEDNGAPSAQPRLGLKNRASATELQLGSTIFLAF